MNSRQPQRPPLAVVGVSALFPGSQDETGFWRDILAGRDLIRDVPPTHWLIEDYYDPDPAAPDKTYARRGAFLDAVPFDALSFGVPPSIVPATDTAQLLALIVARRVLDEAARGQFAAMDRERISVILGVTSGQELLSSMASRLQRPVWVKSLREAGIPESKVREICDRIAGHYVPWQESTFPGLLGNVVAGRIANRFDLGGTNCVTDAACASAAAAVSMAANELWLGQSDLVITGGVDTLNDIFMYLCFSKTPALSRTGDCRPFAEGADGTLLGEGLAMVALKRLADAEADGDRIYAVLRGVGASSDGRARSVYAPRPQGQARALRRAYAAAGYGPASVELVEAHGTGTTAGDAAEFEALSETFDASGRGDRQWCALGSIKSQIGHTKAAAGAAGLFKAVMALHHGVLPPTIKVERPDPKLAIEKSPFYLNTQARPWVRGADHPRRASVSSFGFGGSNFHLALEEYRGPAPRALRKRTAPAELVVLGAATPEALLEILRSIACGGPGFLAWFARHSQETCPRGVGARLALVASDEEDLAAKIAGAAAAITREPGRPFSRPDGVHYGLGVHEGGVALLVPGQGSQYPGMGAGCALLWREALAAWDLAADLPVEGTERLQHVVFPRPAFTEEERGAQAERLTRTEWAQPAIGAAALAHLNLSAAVGLRFDCIGGHSFGEVVALHAAGVFDAATMLRIARRRGELMAAAARTPGAMTVVQAPLETVREALAGLAEVVVANHNAPRQVVLSGPRTAIERAEEELRARAITFRRLEVASAFHSPVVADAAGEFAAFLEGIAFAPPAIPVYANAAAAPYPGDPRGMRTLLASQIARPVRFVEQVEAMYAAGARTFVEVGPGAVLSGLVERILEGRPFHAVSLDAKGKDGVVALHEALGRLWAAGLELDLAALWSSFPATADPRAAKPPAVAIPICGANYGKPYPPPAGTAVTPPNPETRTEDAARQEAPAAPAPSSSPEVPVPLVVAGDPRWAAYQEAQREIIEAHAAWQEMMTRTHLAFLQAAERSMTGLAVPPGASLPPLAWPSFPLPPPAGTAPVLDVQPSWPPASLPCAPLLPAADRPDPASEAAPPPAPSGALAPVLMAIVAEKTGYPVEMLTAQMHLEADLGIDSIKRVEILSALQERAPGSVLIEPSAMTALDTLGAILKHLERPVAAREQSADPRPAGDGDARPPAAQDLAGTLLTVVAEKTGYPVEMLQPQMSLEADLGIDSIKRVEILSALRERVPGLAEVEPAAVAALGTLGAIVSHLQGAGVPVLRGTAAETVAPADDIAAPAAAAAAAVSQVDRFVVEPVAGPASGFGMAGLASASRIVVTDDGAGVADAVVLALRGRGLSAARVEAVPGDADAVIFLGGLRPEASAQAAARTAREAYRAARAVAPRFAACGGIFVTVQDAGGDFGLAGSERAWLAGIAGIAKTAAREWPEASVKAVDLERGGRDAAALAAALIAELFEGGPECEVGLRADGRRILLRAVPRAVVPGEGTALSGQAVVVATGGGQGVTAACLQALAAKAHCRFLLLGRTPLDDDPPACRGIGDEAALKRALLAAARIEGRILTPAELGARARAVGAAREVRATMAAIRAAGGEVRYRVADVRDRAAVAAALLEARRDWGPITALVHGAGVIADKRIAEKSEEQFGAVFDTKVLGLSALLEATAGDPLDAIILFSSVAARFGNAGQCDYAAANEVLNKVAAREARRRGAGCVVRSLGWGPWEGGMVSPALRAHLVAGGTPLIPLAAGAAAFVAEIAGGAGAAAEILLGAPAGPGAPRDVDIAPMAFDVLVTEATHPYLADHSIEDGPVLPVVLALEWFARAAKAAQPNLELVACRDVRVLKGARLKGFSNGGDRFTVTCRRRPGASPHLLLELRGADGTLHYAAAAEMAERLPTPAPPPAPQPPGEGISRVLYGDELFHGPEFQVIRALDGLSADGAAGVLVGTRDRGWRGAWCTDAAALDGGLQLAMLWTSHLLGGRSLPTAFASYHAYRSGTTAGPVRCTLRGRRVGDARTVCDIAFIAGDGTLVSELRGVEVHRRPDPSPVGTRP